MRKKVDPTSRVLRAMLTENTGTHMLDSGGAYGRNWQRNQGHDFEADPATVLSIREGHDGGPEIEITHNVYHWLADRLDYDAKMDAAFRRFCKRKSNERAHWLELAEAWPASRGYSGLYGEGEPMTVNTYNGEDLLSQTIQYVLFSAENETYVLLQIHGGCDVRGGYSRPRVFRVTGYDASILENADAIISEEPDPAARLQAKLFPELDDSEVYWTTDDGWNWYREGACGWNSGRQLKDYPVSTDPADLGQGKIYLAPDGVAYGPVTGGRLIAAAH